MSDKPKENICSIEFACIAVDRSECAYFKTYHSNECVWRKNTNCKSTVAQANALTLKLKELTGE